MKAYYSEAGIEIYHGDCREIVPLLPRGLTVTDPPYNVGYHYANYSDNLAPASYLDLIRAVCPSPCVVVHYAESFFDFAGFLGRPDKIVAWVYPSNTARQWRGIAWWGAEPDFTLDGQEYRNPTDRRIATRIAAGEQARLYDWWQIDQVKNVGLEKTEHPCQIPLRVMQRILRITPADLVIDPFLGSGTTLAAAKQLGIRAIGIEQDERYCEIAAKRMSQEVFNFEYAIS